MPVLGLAALETPPGTATSEGSVAAPWARSRCVEGARELALELVPEDEDETEGGIDMDPGPRGGQAVA